MDYQSQECFLQQVNTNWQSTRSARGSLHRASEVIISLHFRWNECGHRFFTQLWKDSAFPPLVLFPSLTLNQSFLIYQRGFVSWCLIQIPIRKNVWGGGNKRSYANRLTDAISVRNQIRADLNRHRTQNHIRVNLMCMALPSAFILSVPSVFIFLFFFSDLENSLQKHFISRAKANVLHQRYIFSRARCVCFPKTLWHDHI